MSIPEILISIFNILMLLPTLASITKFDHWWIRGFDFPRIQISSSILIAIFSSIFIYDFSAIWEWCLLLLLVLSFLYQAKKIFPYTFLAKKQVMKWKSTSEENHISILMSNVLKTNRNYFLLFDRVNEMKPDLLLTLETDDLWEEQLADLEKDYPYTVKVPQDNLYGMHLYSKFKLLDIEVKFLISDEIPSIHGYLKMDNGKNIEIHCLHPKPPSPTEDETSTNRDAELLLVARNLKEEENAILVLGDLNDVAWSRTTRLFQKISGLLDPRRGRGFFNTFHAGHRFLRWPLDHVFHTRDFSLVKLKRLKSIGSDHFPIYIKLNFEPRAKLFHEKTEVASQEEEEWAHKKIKDGKE